MLYSSERTNICNKPILKYLHSSNFEIQIEELTSETVNDRGLN